MQTNYAIHMLYGPFFHHRFSTANDLFGRLEDKFHIAAQLCPAFTQNIGHGKGNRGMPIVSAGMHFAIDR